MSENRNISKFIVVALIAQIFLLFFFAGAVSGDDGKTVTVVGYSKEEALKLGENMYRQGLLPSGEPMRGFVQGDIPIDSTAFSCLSCHLRSGKGSLEGQVLTFPIDGVTLYNPLSNTGNLSRAVIERYPMWIKKGNFRSAYTDETLAAVMRGGVDPNGRVLSYTMPRYPLDDKDMEIMVFYLKNLSAQPAPGVTPTTITLGTVITADVSQTDREAMLAPLELLLNTWGDTRNLKGRAKRHDLDEETNKGFRKLSLVRWELKGPPESWRNQLEAYYKKEPVFAMVGGISNGDWHPIHAFCEDNRIPCLLPITDFPVISETDWYTLYFSKGVYQEGEAAAKYLYDTGNFPSDRPILQIYRNDNSQALSMSKGFHETWYELTQRAPESLALKPGDIINETFWKKLSASHKNGVILLWLDAKDISSIGVLSEVEAKPTKVFLSSSLLGKEIYSLAEKVRPFAYITYPYRLPGEFKSYQVAIEAWLKNNKIPVTNLMIQSKMFYELTVLSKSLSMQQVGYNRDRVLESQDMMIDDVTSPLYPRLSFGPGQRYVSKGCYIIQLSEGSNPKVIPRSEWVIQ